MAARSSRIVASERERDTERMVSMRPKCTPAERFLPRIQPIESGCWLWMGARTPLGYGRFWTGLELGYAHRFSYEWFVGPIPNRYDLDHLCRNPPCVNPDHLEAVTHRENILRGVGQAAINAIKTECKCGHPYTEANTIRPTSGGRVCRECNRIRLRLRYIETGR
jgi:hypothetical protein